jgi:hypothetical protein
VNSNVEELDVLSDKERSDASLCPPCRRLDHVANRVCDLDWRAEHGPHSNVGAERKVGRVTGDANGSTESQDPQAMLQLLLDERAIVRVALRYCSTIDSKDWAGLADVFVADATADLGGAATLVGLPAITEHIRLALQHLDASQHLVGNHVVEVDGDSATHSCSLQAQHVLRRAEGGRNFLVGGTYSDRLMRTADGWRIVHRRLSVVWSDGNRAVGRPS